MAAENLAGGLRQQADDGHGGHAFATAGLADDADGFAGGHGERHLVDGAQQAAFGFERGDELVHLQDVVAGAGHGVSRSVRGSGGFGAGRGSGITR
jgi:hypothetical protein